MTLNLHEDGLILCENGAGLSHGRLNASHPVREGCMGSHKGCCCSGERADCIHDGKKVLGRNSDMLRRWCGSAHRNTVCRGGTGGRGPEKTEGSRAGSNGAGDSCHGRVIGINKNLFPMFLLLP